MEFDFEAFDNLSDMQMMEVVKRTFGLNFPVSEVRRILNEPTMEEIHRYGSRFNRAMKEIQMERRGMSPASPQLDYYVGRKVNSITAVKGGEEGWWAIHLDGGISITNEDTEIEMPNEEARGVIEGAGFLRTILSLEETRLQFGYPAPPDSDEPPHIVAEISLKPTQYRISDKAYPDGPHYPQRATETPIAIEDPSVDRVVEMSDEALLDQARAKHEAGEELTVREQLVLEAAELADDDEVEN